MKSAGHFRLGSASSAGGPLACSILPVEEASESMLGEVAGTVEVTGLGVAAWCWSIFATRIQMQPGLAVTLVDVVVERAAGCRLLLFLRLSY